MNIRPAHEEDCLAIAELALIAGDGIPGHFWAESQLPGQSLTQTGARLAASNSANFSYRNAHIARIGDRIAGMLLGYRLPAAADNSEDPTDLPEFVRPLVELEQSVPESFYINMVATYPQYRGKGVGSALMTQVDRLATNAACKLISIEVFDSNQGALRLYQRLGYELADARPMIASSYHAAGKVLLLTKNAVCD